RFMSKGDSGERGIDRIRDSAGMFTIGDENDGAVKSLAELLMVYLSGHHVASLGKFPIGVGEIPGNQRRDGVRYGYLIQFGGSIHRLG
ncbi:hypothetical protein V8P78_34030, partial [Rhizobium sp. 6AS6]